MTHKNLIYVGLAILGLGTTMAFQNCGQGVVAGSGEVQSESVASTEIRAGDAFKIELMPRAAQGALVNDLTAYDKVTGFKSIAIAKNGMGAARGSERFASQEEADRLLLEMCQLVSGNQPCVTVAQGDVFKYSTSEFAQAEDAAVSVLKSGARSVVVSEIPGFPQYWEALFTTQYAETTNPYKAIAFGAYGKVVRGWGATQAEATRRAFEMCEAMDTSPCSLYAEANTVLFNVSSFQMASAQSYLKFGPLAFVPSTVPFITNAQRASAAVTGFRNSYQAGQRPVMAVSRYVHMSIVANSSRTLAENRTAALAACNTALNDITRGCIVYAQEGDVVMNRADMIANKF